MPARSVEMMGMNDLDALYIDIDRIECQRTSPGPESIFTNQQNTRQSDRLKAIMGFMERPFAILTSACGTYRLYHDIIAQSGEEISTVYFEIVSTNYGPFHSFLITLYYARTLYHAHHVKVIVASRSSIYGQVETLLKFELFLRTTATVLVLDRCGPIGTFDILQEAVAPFDTVSEPATGVRPGCAVLTG